VSGSAGPGRDGRGRDGSGRDGPGNEGGGRGDGGHADGGHTDGRRADGGQADSGRDEGGRDEGGGHLRRLFRAARRQPLVAALAVLALVLTLAFALRLALGPAPGARDPDLAGWMPLGYVAQTWDIPREVLAEALGLEPGAAPRRSLRSLADDRGEPVEALLARIAAAIAAHRAAAPRPTPSCPS